MCRALDHLIDVDNDAELLADKSVLELGFCTGLPSVLALDHGAARVRVHSLDETAESRWHVKATLERNQVDSAAERPKVSAANLNDSFRRLRGELFDLVLAVEPLQTEQPHSFEQLHDLLDQVLSAEGIVLLSARPFYADSPGSLQAFLDVCKRRGVFDAHLRWTSRNADFSPRRLVQLTRSIR